MKIFISWSGDRSKKVAELMNDWIQCVIQAVIPWMSSKDIDRGALWFNEITDQLANTSIGIICLTKENKNKPWILFESGALAKGLTSNRVCTFLIDLAPTDIENPLAQFNHSFPTKESVWELVRTINIYLKENSLKEVVLLKVFETYWPQFETDFQEILRTTPEVEVVDKRHDNDLILDVLTTVRQLDKRLRNIEVGAENQVFKYENRISRKENQDFLMTELRIDMKNLLESNLSDEMIFDIIANKFPIPRSTIRREFDRIKNFVLDKNFNENDRTLA